VKNILIILIQIMSVIASIVNVVAYYFVAKKDILGIKLWIVGNTLMLILAIYRIDIGQICMWVAYNILNIYALKNWKENGK